MNTLLWVLQILAALLYGSSGIMKLFLFDKVSQGVQSFGALPRGVWHALGVLELLCVIGLVVPGALHWHNTITVAAAALLALESFVFIWVHIKYREIGTIVMSAVLGLILAFIAYGRCCVKPL